MQKIMPSVFFIMLIVSINAYPQITKGNWLLSGSASFSRLQSSSQASVQYKQTDFQISSSVGYFLMDKFAVGLKPSLLYGSNNVGNSSKVITIGPFARYYFLKPENIFNLFSEGAYGYGIFGGGQKSNTFSVAAGPVLYFNSSVGLEFTIGYSTTKFVGFSGSNNLMLVGIGLQFHLEKDE